MIFKSHGLVVQLCFVSILFFLGISLNLNHLFGSFALAHQRYPSFHPVGRFQNIIRSRSHHLLPPPVLLARTIGRHPITPQEFGRSRGKSTNHGKGHEKPSMAHQNKNKETSLDDILEVMGPHLFLVPFVLKLIPFAIPSLPLSYILSRYAPPTIAELFERLMELNNQISEALMPAEGEAGGEG